MQRWSRAEPRGSTSPLLPGTRAGLPALPPSRPTLPVCPGCSVWPTGPMVLGFPFPNRCQHHMKPHSYSRGPRLAALVPLSLVWAHRGGTEPAAPRHPQSFERGRGRVLTFSTSSLQSCGGHRATGKEISVGDVEKHRALTPSGEDAPRAGSGDELALHPAAAAGLLPLGLGPAPLSSVSQRGGRLLSSQIKSWELLGA